MAAALQKQAARKQGGCRRSAVQPGCACAEPVRCTGAGRSPRMAAADRSDSVPAPSTFSACCSSQNTGWRAAIARVPAWATAKPAIAAVGMPCWFPLLLLLTTAILNWPNCTPAVVSVAWVMVKAQFPLLGVRLARVAAVWASADTVCSVPPSTRTSR